MHLSGRECVRADVTVDDEMKKKEEEETTFSSLLYFFYVLRSSFNNIILVYYCCALFYPYVAYVIRFFKVCALHFFLRSNQYG